MRQPVLFLDVDGVLCTPLSVRLDWLARRPVWRQRFDPIALFWLGRLARRSGARVVLASSWRYSLAGGDPVAARILQNLYAALAAHGAPVADIAPILGATKGEEVAAWLAAHPGTPCAILDDRPADFDAAPALRPYLAPVDPARGLRRRDCRRALAILRAQTITKEVPIP